jgi:hypothetical protein
MLSKAGTVLANAWASLATSARKFRGATDYRRWGKTSNLSPDWDVRTRMIAGLINPGASVLEFGAGRMVLKTFLPANCTYTPSDIVDRGPGTLICDLNGKTLPPFPRHNVAVFSGVLEYIIEIQRLADHLAAFVDVVIASYAVTDLNRGPRRMFGWVNDFSSAQIVQIFEHAGFNCEKTDRWEEQIIYRFVRSQKKPVGAALRVS